MNEWYVGMRRYGLQLVYAGIFFCAINSFAQEQSRPDSQMSVPAFPEPQSIVTPPQDSLHDTAGENGTVASAQATTVAAGSSMPLLPAPSVVALPTQAVPSVQPTHSVDVIGTQTAGLDDLLDTLDIQEGGNWLLVRKALEDTVDTIEDLNVLFTAILDNRMVFLKKRNQADKEFDQFLSTIGGDLGQLSSGLAQILNRLDEEKIEDGDLDENERSILQATVAEQEELKKLQEQVKMIAETDAKLDDIVMTVEDQVNVCRDFQNQAWKNFQALKRVYDDEKAEDLYQKTETLLMNMQQVAEYLKRELTTFMDTTVTDLSQSMKAAQSSITTLENAGVALKAQLKELMQKEDAADLQKLKDASCALPDEASSEQKEGFFSGVISAILSLFAYIQAAVSGLLSKIVSIFSGSLSE